MIRLDFTLPNSTARDRKAKGVNMTDVIEAAIKAGKIPESRRGFYERELARAPVRTTRLLAKLAPGLPPGSKIGRQEEVQRGPITSSAGLPLRPHPLGGYYVDTT